MNKPKVLPEITIGNCLMFVDFRLKELRPAFYPFISIGFDSLDEKTKAEVRKIRAEQTSYGYIKSLDN